jgi:hypothetical protein
VGYLVAKPQSAKYSRDGSDCKGLTRSAIA